MSVDRQGRLVLPLEVRRRLGLEGRAGQLRLVETADGVLLEAPPANVTVSTDPDGLPLLSIEGLAEPVTNDRVLEAIDAERSGR